MSDEQTSNTPDRERVHVGDRDYLLSTDPRTRKREVAAIEHGSAERPPLAPELERADVDVDAAPQRADSQPLAVLAAMGEERAARRDALVTPRVHEPAAVLERVFVDGKAERLPVGQSGDERVAAMQAIRDERKAARERADAIHTEQAAAGRRRSAI